MNIFENNDELLRKLFGQILSEAGAGLRHFGSLSAVAGDLGTAEKWLSGV